MTNSSRDVPRFRKAVPYIAAALTLATYVIILEAGHSSAKALLVAAFMAAFCGFLMLVHTAFGNKAGAVLMISLALALALARHFGWW